jgi:hypothetical protein
MVLGAPLLIQAMKDRSSLNVPPHSRVMKRRTFWVFL